MKLSELQSLLGRIQQLAGDVDVVLKAADSEAETVITDLGIHLDATSAAPTSTLTITHGTAPAPAAADPPAPEDPPA
jgi:hypothetical protein